MGHLHSHLPPNEASYEHLTAHTLELENENATTITNWTSYIQHYKLHVYVIDIIVHNRLIVFALLLQNCD